jgi:L,D-transpeptidase catalytic domain
VDPSGRAGVTFHAPRRKPTIAVHADPIKSVLADRVNKTFRSSDKSPNPRPPNDRSSGEYRLKPPLCGGWTAIEAMQRLDCYRGSVMSTRAFLSVSLAAGIAIVTATATRADIAIAVDKNSQQMSVSVDGVPRYLWTVSTGRAGYGTPNGTYRPQRLEKTWFSREYYNSPMPHSIFFHGGYAIHGSYEINRLGGPASHGCIRLHPANAATLFALVKGEGMSATTIVVSGQNSAIAPRRGPALESAPAPVAPDYGSGYTPYHEAPWQRPGSYDYRFYRQY